ncbi:MAG TPA: hypothetical protein VF316_10060 [Polyangiaceae bacterium]
MKLAFPSLLVLSLAACGGSVAPATDGGAADSATDTGVGECPIKTPGKNIWDVTPADCLRGVTLQDHGGGFGPSPPPGSECTGGATYTLTVATRALSWEIYVIGNPYPFPWQLQKGQRTLTPTELGSVATAMKQVVVAGTVNTCGADKPLLTVTVSTPKYAQEYTDSIYQCQGQGKLYVDSIDGAFTAVAALVP